MIIGLADRWHCRPSQVLKEDASILRMLDVYNLGTPEPEGGEDG